MPHDRSVEALLRRRLALAELDAPPPPRAAFLIERARPAWEREPARFQVRVARLRRMPAAAGYAMSGTERARGAGLVPVVIVSDHDIDTYAQIVYVSAQDGRLRMRFTVDADGLLPPPAWEMTLLADGTDAIPCGTTAELSQSGEYRADVALPLELADMWVGLKVTDRMPFRLILHVLRPTTPVHDPAAGT